MKILFVCSANINRSPTCARVFKEYFKDDKKLEVKSAGIFAGNPLQFNEELAKWADKIFVMDLSHFKFMYEKYANYFYKVEMMGIGDIYNRDEEELVDLIKWWIDRNW